MTDVAGVPPITAALDEFLACLPLFKPRRSELQVTFDKLYRGIQWPPFYFLEIRELIDTVPWAIELLRGATIPPADHLQSVHEPESFERIENWSMSHVSFGGDLPRRWINQAWSRQIEALVIVGLWRNQAIPDQAFDLARFVLNEISEGLAGRSKYRRSHPLKKVLAQLDTLETAQELLRGFDRILPEVRALYPRIAIFLRALVRGVLLGEHSNWSEVLPKDISDLLGVRSPPGTDAGGGGGPPAQPVPVKRQTRVFTAADAAAVMAFASADLAPFQTDLEALAGAWRGEDVWGFFESMARLASRIRWLRPFLESRARPAALAAIRITTHSRYAEKYFWPKLRRWCDQHDVEVPPWPSPSALIVESSRHALSGVDQIKGLLAAARLIWGAEQSDAQTSLVDVLHVAKQLVGKPPATTFHPLRLRLNDLGDPATPAEFADRLVRLVPDMGAAVPGAGSHFTTLFLPLLRNGLTAAAYPTPPSDVLHPGGNASTKGAQRKHRVRTTIRRARVVVPAPNAPLPGESTEETQSARNFVQRPARITTPRLIKEIKWAQQRVWGSNPLLVREHIECLSDAEAIRFGAALMADMKSRIECGDVGCGWTSALVALVLATGQRIDNCAVLAMAAANGSSPQHDFGIDLAAGVLKHEIPRPEQAYQPNDEERRLLEPTTEVLDLPLPPGLLGCLRTLVPMGGPEWSNDSAALRQRVDAYIDRLDGCPQTGVTTARIRLTLRARTREATGDLAATMLICGDSFGLSTAPLYYACIPRRKLERAYTEAAWPCFGDPVPPASQDGSKVDGRVGSRLLVKRATAANLTRSLHVPTWAVTNKKVAGLATMHNALVVHMLCMLAGAAGHRPDEALLDLRRFDFDPEIYAAVFSDKKTDAAHLHRFAPLPAIVAHAIDGYLNHLRRLASLPISPPDTVARVLAAVRGDERLFFHLSAELQPETITRAAWVESLPPEWQSLPLNWGRTFLASRGRDAGIDPDHLSVVLGHLESAGYPFSSESPMGPAALSNTIAEPLSKVVEQAGWSLRKGLTYELDDAERLAELGPLRDWAAERRQLAQQLHDFRRADRLAWRAAFRRNRERGEDMAYAALGAALGKELRIFHGPTETHLLDIGLVVADTMLAAVQSSIDTSAPNEVVRIAAQNALYRILRYAHKHLQWNCAVPGPWLAPPTAEPTPFFPGMLRATQQVRTIRERYRTIPTAITAVPTKSAANEPPNGPAEHAPFTQFEWACGIAVLSLCAFGFVGDLEQLRDILCGRVTRVRCLAVDDLLFVEGAFTRRTHGLRGLAAIAVARLASAFPDDALPAEARLDAVLASQLPPALVGQPHGLAARLCATVAVANLAELSGMARTGLDAISGCVPMSAFRQRQLLEEGYGAPEAPANTPDTHLAPNPDAPERLQGPDAPRAPKVQYRQLVDALHIGDGPKLFKLTRTKLSAAVVGSFRTPLINELLAFLAQGGLDPIVASIAAYSLYLTQYGTPEEKEPAWRTVYKYINSFGSDLLVRAADLDFLQLDGEEYTDLYQELVDNKHTEKRRALAIRELANFHHFLQRTAGVEDVDFAEIEGSVGSTRGNVDADLIQPQEYMAGLDILRTNASKSGAPSTASPEDRRLARQSLQFAILLRASGARYQELAALRFQDVLATTDSLQLFIRPTGRRRLKTASGRRFIDLSKRVTCGQRKLVAEWVTSERERMRTGWFPTLPLFTLLGSPGDRTAADSLRDVFLNAMAAATGVATKIHRGRHLVANETLLRLVLSDPDWYAMRVTRARARRVSIVRRRPGLPMPRDARRESLSFGHRHGWTTLVNYGHVPWALLSRPTDLLMRAHTSRQTLAVALGVPPATADKVLLRARAKYQTKHPAMRSRIAPTWVSAGLAHTTPAPKPMEAWTAHRHIAAIPIAESTLRARTVERTLRAVQSGVAERDVCLTHGLTTKDLTRLLRVAGDAQRQTGIPILLVPRSNARVPRPLDAAGSLNGLLDYADASPGDPKYRLVCSVANAYMRYAQRAARGIFEWPETDAKRLVRLLRDIGISDDQIRCANTEGGKIEVKVMRPNSTKLLVNQAIAWLLTVVYITASSNEDVDLATSSGI